MSDKAPVEEAGKWESYCRPIENELIWENFKAEIDPFDMICGDDISRIPETSKPDFKCNKESTQKEETEKLVEEVTESLGKKKIGSPISSKIIKKVYSRLYNLVTCPIFFIFGKM